jgi:hypothetical protein
MMKIDASPPRPMSGSGAGAAGAQQKTTTTTTGKLTIDAERSTQRATEVVTTTKTTKVIVSAICLLLAFSFHLTIVYDFLPLRTVHAERCAQRDD